uniref:Uncharacterized protein n=1 Tax=Podoviridae sp. ctU7u6 TaxID=2825252 RepID=A0A8S5P9Q3_9CAUD|nr:MAG TPA: hypothetical protein [Podoviridae sp. ctU7u6]DAL04602.1 MAG TPA: hypothetical protein [Caudoviricetes sp.]DAS74286.1 MAG TPA: hypothetical protein [Caudoviricetes sp.]DAV68373.1 MAG TPA: hypothetical protein [Caudoviricetes sp.]
MSSEIESIIYIFNKLIRILSFYKTMSFNE